MQRLLLKEKEKKKYHNLDKNILFLKHSIK